MKMRWLSLLAGTAALASLCQAQPSGMWSAGGFGGGGALRGIGSDAAQESRPRSPKANWRPWLRVSGYYNDQITFIDDGGNIANSYDNRGGYANWGLSGSKLVEKTSVFGVYSGSALLLSNRPSLNGTSHVFQLGAGHRFNRRVYGEVQQMLGTGIGGFGFGSGFAGLGSSAGSLQAGILAPGNLFGFGDPGINGFVDQETFANRTNFSGSVGTLSYRLSLRSTVSGSGGVFFTRRTSTALSDLNSYMAGSGYMYALNRRTEIGVGYGYGSYNFPNVFGGNRVQTLNLQLNRKFGENGGIASRIGVTRFDSSYIGLVPVDPDLAAILGISAMTAAQQAKRATISGDLHAYYHTDALHVAFVANRSAIPGNGIMYGAMRDMVYLNLSRTLGTDRLIGGLTAGVARNSGFLQSEVQTLTQANGTLSFTLFKGMALTAAGGVRWQRLNRGAAALPSRFAAIGLGWTPGDRPFLF